MESSSNIGGSSPVSNSRRPVSGISASQCSPTIASGDKAYTLPMTGQWGWANLNEVAPLGLIPDPVTWFQTQPSPPTVDCTLDFVGRNHGVRQLGNVAGSPVGGWDLRQSNFLYVDGHVETKNVAQTVYPQNQWGADFYSLQQ